MNQTHKAHKSYDFKLRKLTVLWNQGTKCQRDKSYDLALKAGFKEPTHYVHKRRSLSTKLINLKRRTDFIYVYVFNIQ